MILLFTNVKREERRKSKKLNYDGNQYDLFKLDSAAQWKLDSRTYLKQNK